VIYEFTIGKNTKMCIALSLHTHPGEKFMACDWQHDLKSLVNYIKTHCFLYTIPDDILYLMLGQSNAG